MRRLLLAPATGGAVAAATLAPPVGIRAERAESIEARLELLSSDDGTWVRAVWRP